MATSATYTADGVNDTYTIPFPYIETGHVVVSLDGVPQPSSAYTFPTTAGSVKMNVVPSAGTLVKIQRSTPAFPITEYQTGGVLTKGDLEVDSKQPLFLIEEFADNKLDEPAVVALIEEAGADGLGAGFLRADLLSGNPGKGADLVTYRVAGTGTGAADRTVSDKLRDSVSVRDFGAVGDGVADDTAAFVEALASGSGLVLVPAGTYMLASNITVPADTILRGVGIKSVLKPSAAMTTMVTLGGDYAQLVNLNLQNVGTLATRGVTVGVTFYTKVLDNYFGNGLNTAIYLDGAQIAWIERNHVLNCSFGIFNNNDGRGHRITNNLIQGGTGIWFRKTTQQPEGVRIIGNEILPNITADPNSGHGIVIESGLEFQVIANMCGNVDKDAILLTGTAASSVAHVKLIGNWCDNDSGAANAEGLFVAGNVNDLLVYGNSFVNSVQRGIHIDSNAGIAPQRLTFDSNRFLNCGTGDMQIVAGFDISIVRNRFSHATSQLREEVNTITSRVTDNYFSVAPAPRSTASRYYDNAGPGGSNSDNGVYTPGVGHIANVSASGALATTWSRTGDTVTVAGRLDITPAVNGTLTQVSLTLPVATDLILNGDLGGAATARGASSAAAGTLTADTAGNLAVLSFFAPGTASTPVCFSFSYRVQ